MSLWQEDDKPSTTETASVCDVHFRICCQSLPSDHAFALSEAVYALAPWLDNLPNAGVQAVHVAASQNGWERPELSCNSELMPSRRTRLKIRVNCNEAERLIDSLSDKSISVQGHALQILAGQPRALLPSATLFSRYTVFTETPPVSSEHHHQDESQFVQAVVDGCRQLGFQPTKLLCGKGHLLAKANTQVFCRSVLLADVPAEYSLRLQESGIGALRRMGCGILLPHKDTGAVHQITDDA